MTSKTFRDAKVEMDNIEVAIDYDGDDFFYITLIEAGNAAQIQLANSIAPALALAILEAAGYKGILASEEPGNLIEKAYSAIRLHIKEQERATAEAKAQAELEAEALELLNAVRKHHGKPERTWSDTHNDVREEFIAVARKARELAEEATK